MVNEVNYSEKLTPYFEVFLLIREEKFDDDIRIECTSGIHFYITRKEAEEHLNN